MCFCPAVKARYQQIFGEMDQISELPESILHHILSFINAPAELVRMSVLSKTWFDLTASFPILVFHIDGFISRETFFKYVDYATSRFCHQNVIAQKLELITNVQEPAELDVVNRCLELVLKKGVKVLVVDNNNTEGSHVVSDMPMQTYRLPNILLSVASMLESLIIRDCELPSSLMVDAVQFKSLIKLELDHVHIDDEVINYITISCPVLEELRIYSCYDLKRFCVYGHQNLKDVYISFVTPLERIDIEAPNLSCLGVLDVRDRGAPTMNLASCNKLTTVHYTGHSLPNDFLSNFPYIEVLFLSTICEGKNLKLSSHTLKKLSLCSYCDLEDVEFNFPNLEAFCYSHDYRFLVSSEISDRLYLSPLIEPQKDSTQVNAFMVCYLNGSYINNLWFHKLRLFLEKKNGFKVMHLYTHVVYSQMFKELEKLKTTELPSYELEHFELKQDTHEDAASAHAIELPYYELEHFELQLDTHEESSAHVGFMDAALCCFHPRSITLGSFFYLTRFEDVVKFTYEKLLEQEDGDHTKIQILSPSSSKAQKECMDLKSLLMALPCEGKTISFIREQGNQEEAG